MAVNNRIYYPGQNLIFFRPGAQPTDSVSGIQVHGLQTVSKTTTFVTEQVFEIGQLAIYQNVEDLPTVELSTNKVLDGFLPVYPICMAWLKNSSQVLGPTLVERQNAEIGAQLGIYAETDNGVDGKPLTACQMSGMQLSSVSYTFGTDGNFTEDVTLQGNNVIWESKTGDIQTLCNIVGPNLPWGFAITGADGLNTNNDNTPASFVNRRQDLQMAYSTGDSVSADYTILPKEIQGVSVFNYNASDNGYINYAGGSVGEAPIRVTSATVSTDLAREDLFELGKRSPFLRTVTFPVEVTCDIEVISSSGDLVNAIDDCRTTGTCQNVSNLTDQKIRFATCEGTRIYLGDKNQLTSVSYGGGDAGGGNVSVTYSYRNFNDFTVMHLEESGWRPSAASEWNTRSGYMGASFNNNPGE